MLFIRLTEGAWIFFGQWLRAWIFLVQVRFKYMDVFSKSLRHVHPLKVKWSTPIDFFTVIIASHGENL